MYSNNQLILKTPITTDLIKSRHFKLPTFRSYKQCLTESIKEHVLSSYMFEKTDYSDRAVNCFSERVTTIMQLGIERPKFINDHFRGYQIPAKIFNNLSRSALYNFFWLIFERAEGSTYHRNDSVHNFNGYTHWYTGTELFSSIIERAKLIFTESLEHYVLFSKKVYSLQGLTDTAHNITGDNTFRIKLDVFWEEYNLFDLGKNKAFPLLLKNAKHIDSRYIYFNNKLDSTIAKEESELFSKHPVKGRVYTVFTSLPKIFRQRILSNYIEIDIDCAVQSINMIVCDIDTKHTKPNKCSRTTNFSHKFKEHQKLLNNKYLFRTLMASNFKINQKTAKTAILQMSYAPKSNITRKLCSSAKRTILAKKGIKPFRDECLEVQQIVVDKLYNAVDTGENPYFKIGNLQIGDIKEMVDESIRVHNLKLLHSGAGRTKLPRVHFRVYELVEHQIRKEMINFIESQGINEIYQIHDACVIPYDIDIKKLKLHIKSTLGFDLNFTASVY